MSSQTGTSHSKPHLLLLGATGRTGRQLLKIALEQNYAVTALARNLETLPSFTSAYQSAQFTTIQGDTTSESAHNLALQSALSHSTNATVVSTLGQTRATSSPFSRPASPPLYMTQSLAALLSSISSLPASLSSRINKLIIMSMFGAGDSFANLHCAVKPVMWWSSMAQTVEDHDGVDGTVKERTSEMGLHWIMVRPAMLKEGEAKDVIVRKDDGKGEGWIPSSVTTGSVVSFMMDCVESGEFDGRTPVICN